MYGRNHVPILWAVIAVLTALFAAGQLPAAGHAVEREPEPAILPHSHRHPLPLSVPFTEPEQEEGWACAADMAADHIFVYDCSKREMRLCNTDPQDSLYPASITKLFSAWVALQLLEPDAEVQAGRELGLLQPGSSTAYISYGSVLTVRMLVEGMLLPSGNDAAYVLASAAGRAIAEDEALPARQAVDLFVEEMNRQAQALGLTGSHFENPDGYHSEGHYSCPRDLAVIGTLALENEIISRYARTRSDSVRFVSGETCTWRNTNRLLNPDSEYYCPEAVGLKTGYTGQAGQCLLAAFDTGNGLLLVGIFGGESKTGRYEYAAQLLAQARETDGHPLPSTGSSLY